MSDTVRPIKREKLPASAPNDLHCQGKPFKVSGGTLGAYQWSKTKKVLLVCTSVIGKGRALMTVLNCSFSIKIVVT